MKRIEQRRRAEVKVSNGWSVLDWIVLAVVADVMLAVAYCDWAYDIAEWLGYAAR